MIFLRRTRHVASILTLLLAAGSLASAQSPRQQQRQEANRQPSGPPLLVPPAPAHEAPRPVPQPPDSEGKPYDWLKWRYDWLSPSTLTQLGLISVAIWGGYIALRTLKAIEREVVETSVAAAAAKKSADIAAAALESADRPWVTVRVAIAGSLLFTTDGHCLLPLTISLVNVGRSVANHLDLKVFMLPWFNASGDEQSKRNGIWGRFNTWLTTQKPALGFTAFPNEPMTRTVTVHVSAMELDAAWQRFAPNALKIPVNQRPMPLLVFGRLMYTQAGFKTQRHTDFGYEVMRIDPGGPSYTRFEPRAEMYPADRLTLEISRIGLHNAD